MEKSIVVKDSDLWQTPDDLFTWLKLFYNVDIDLCASADNKKCKQWCESILTVPDDFLKDNRCGFMNPPYSDIAPFIEKAWHLSKHCPIVMLVPSSIKTCKYMDFLDKFSGKGYCRQWVSWIRWIDLPRRTKFTHPAKKVSSPSFGCSILILDRTNKRVLDKIGSQE